MSSALVLSRLTPEKCTPGTVRKSTSSGASASDEEELLRLLPGLDCSRLAPHLLRVEVARPYPLPDLRARDLRGRGVLHQVVDRRRADAVQPRVEVADADRHVRAQPLLGDLARRVGDREQRRLVRDDVLAQPVDLVRPVAEHARRRSPSRPERDRGGRPRCRRSRRSTRAPCPRAPSRARRGSPPDPCGTG